MNRWQFLDATPRERDLFCDLHATLACAGERTGPRNRTREVRLVRSDAGLHYLKIFHRTQWKNRIRNLCTAPHCAHDGQREARVAAALQQRGIAVARPVVVGTAGASSYYLTAALAGESVGERWTRGAIDRDQLDAIAQFAAEPAQRGVVLTDISADHIFAVAGGYAIIDLHNGRVGRPRQRDVRRMARRFRRSLGATPPPRRWALRFAVRWLERMAWSRPRRRRFISNQPALDTHSRYDRPGKSKTYSARNPARHHRELALLRELWPGQPGDLVLDAPCGTGRVGRALAASHGARVVGADRSLAMLREGRSTGSASAVLADASQLPFAGGAFDGVVVFRFLHHLDHRSMRALLGEAARCSRRYVVVSFFHPCSSHAVMRRLRGAIVRRPAARFTVSRRQLTSWLATLGYRPTAWRAERPYMREFWIGAFERTPTAGRRPG